MAKREKKSVHHVTNPCFFLRKSNFFFSSSDYKLTRMTRMIIMTIRKIRGGAI